MTAEEAVEGENEFLNEKKMNDLLTIITNEQNSMRHVNTKWKSISMS